MKMGLPIRCRYWSVLHVVAIVIYCYQKRVSSEFVEGCVGSQLNLTCEERKVIQITALVLGDYGCQGTSCCIRNGDCSRNANESHTTDVHRRCDNKESCVVTVVQERIRCGYWPLSTDSVSDFERITYSCVDDPGNIAEGCVGSQLNLTCEEMKIIQITAVVLGESKCREASCCIKYDGCIYRASESHTRDVHSRCDNNQSCTVTVLQEGIACGRFWSSTNSDFERVTYNCVDDPRYIAQGCTGSQLSLACEETKVIQIISVVLGDSDCIGTSCCIKHSDCTRNANSNHRKNVHHRCDNKQSCTVRILTEAITCGVWGTRSDNDFERITYICVNETQNDAVNSTAEQESMQGNRSSAHKSGIVEGCVGNQLNLTCGDMKVIKITAVIVGNIVGKACYIRQSYCTIYANENHATDVHRRCNGQSNCTVVVLMEVIPCELEFNSNNGFEHIAYDCVDSLQNDMTSPDGTFRRPNNNKEAYNKGDTGRTTDHPNSQALPVVVVIICLIILLTVVVLFIVYRRKQRAQMKSFNPVAMTEVGNQQNESNIYADESKTTSLHENNAALSVPLVQDPPVYSEMAWKDDLSKSAAADESKATIEAHVTGPDVYAEVNKPSKTAATASAVETDWVEDTGPVKTGDYFPDQIYSLASNNVADIYVNEQAADSETIPLQDDDGQTVIENDLYNL